jgi:hypothetical protein
MSEVENKPEVKEEVKPKSDKAAKEALKKDVDNGKYAVKSKDYAEYEQELAIKNIPLMGSKQLALQLESKRVPDAFKKLCKAELDKRVAAREAKAKAAK